VQYSNSSGDADYMENLYYLYNYIIACGGMRIIRFTSSTGFSAVQTSMRRSGAMLLYWNQRDIYNSFLASNIRVPEVLTISNYVT